MKIDVNEIRKQKAVHIPPILEMIPLHQQISYDTQFEFFKHVWVIKKLKL